MIDPKNISTPEQTTINADDIMAKYDKESGLPAAGGLFR